MGGGGGVVVGKGVCTCPGLVAWLLKEFVFEQDRPWA